MNFKMYHKLAFVFVIVGFLLYTSAETKVFEVDENLSLSKEDSPKIVPKKWISQVMIEAELTFVMDPNVSRQCREDTEIYNLHVENQTVWAIRSSYFK